MLWLVLGFGCTSVRVDEGLIGVNGGVIETEEVRLEIPRGALDGAVEVRVRTFGAPPQDLDTLSALWSIEPAGIELSVPATLSFPVPDGVNDASIYLGDANAFESMGGVIANGRISVSISTLSMAFVGGSVIVPVGPSPNPGTFVPAVEPPPLAPAGTVPQAGEPWTCGTGMFGIIDLADFDDTAMPTEPDILCEAGISARVGGVAHGSLATAIRSATAGDVVEVCPGVHVGPFGDVQDGVTLEGVATNPASTVLTGRLQGTVLTAQGELTLRRLTIRRGYEGGVRGGEGLSLEDMRFEQNVSCGGGGAVNATDAVSMLRSSFTNNVSGYDGGAASLGIRWYPADLHIEDCLFENNRSGYQGGALVVDGDGGRIEILSTEFLGNTTGYEGGALVNGSWESHELHIEGCLFEDNQAGYEAAAVSLASWSEADDVTLIDTLFRNNGRPGEGPVSIHHWNGGTFVFDGVELDEPGTCVLVADIDGAGTPAEITLLNMTMSGPAAVCAYGNTSISLDGHPL